MTFVSAKQRTTRLSADDWVDGALELIVAEGVSGLKVARLCAQLEVTKGSFYWHFKDLGDLWSAMADKWYAVQRENFAELEELSSIEASERLMALTEMLAAQRSLAVESAIREWARLDANVAEMVQAMDREVFGVVEVALRELDYSPARARVLAGLLVYAGIGYIYGRDSLPTPTEAELNELVTMVRELNDH